MTAICIIFNRVQKGALKEVSSNMELNLRTLRELREIRELRELKELRLSTTHPVSTPK